MPTHTVWRLQSHWGRAPIVGAAAGAGAMSLVALVGMMIPDPLSGLAGAPTILLIFGFAYLPWLAGIVFVGGPLWWAFHRLGLRGPVIPVVLGAALVALVLTGFVTHWFGLQSVPETTEAISDGRYLIRGGAQTEYARQEARSGLISMALLGLFSGGAAGFALWRSAYRRDARAS